MTAEEQTAGQVSPDDALWARWGVPAWMMAGQEVLFPPRDRYLELARRLRESGYEVCVDLCGVDYLDHRDRPLPPEVQGERFEVVANFLSLSMRKRIRLRVQVPEDDPSVDSLFDIYPGTEAMERETFDMFGIIFVNHPDLTRILMPEDWEGHPLRKDYAIGRVPVAFKETPEGR